MGTRGVIKWSTLILGLLAVFFVPARGIECYQCSSIDNAHIFQCNEYLTSDIDMKPESCDEVYGAKFCVKRVGKLNAMSLNCYQCTSAHQWTCQESVLTEEALKPESCEHVYGAQYCIKTTGEYGGGVGTKRFCSSVDLGNRCDEAQLPGDSLEYRTCVYTCSSDGCNPGTRIVPSAITLGFLTLIILCFIGR